MNMIFYKVLPVNTFLLKYIFEKLSCRIKYKKNIAGLF
jgi:hypothetical protein